jgi:hypothetical protein
MEDQMMQDLLWSDPCDEPGLALNDRGAGCLFGEDITDNFLHHNKLKMIVRSHECVDDGCEATHSNKVYTLFSASNYCGDAGNYGAIMMFHHKKHSPTEIHQYLAPVLDVEKGTSMAEKEEAAEREEKEERQRYAEEQKRLRELQQQEEAEEKASAAAGATAEADSSKLTKLSKLVDKLAEYILRYHEDLEFHFHKVDIDNHGAVADGDDKCGTVTLQEWSEIMSDTLQLKLDWHKLRPFIAPDGADDAIDYSKFLGRYYINFDGDHSFFDGIVDGLREAIFMAGHTIREGFEGFDEVSTASVVL